LCKVKNITQKGKYSMARSQEILDNPTFKNKVVHVGLKLDYDKNLSQPESKW
jgi:hypothetical protein